MSNPFDAKNFYHFMKITGTTAGYKWNDQRHFIAAPSPINLVPEGYNQDANTTVFDQAK